MKKGELIAIAILGMIFLLPFASAGILNWITGKASSQNLTMGADVGNTAPIITYVAPVSATNPVEGSTRTVTFKFTAYDHDNNNPAVHDLTDGSARAELLNGATTRSATCTIVAEDKEKTSNYTCSVDMYYWDTAASWKINVTIKDASNAWAENSTTSFTYNSLTAFVMAPVAINWTSLSPGSTDNQATNDPSVLNNTGNYESTNIQINTTTLVGVTDNTKTIGGSNFTSKIDDPACTGTVLSEVSEYVQVASAALPKGNLSAGSGAGQEELYYCLDVPASVTKQTYDTSAKGAWTVKVV
jgi:hypothetical protein